MEKFDLIVIGGGAAGLMAALSAAKTFNTSGAYGKIAVLEGNNKLGKKLLATGNGRCNLSNLNLSSEHFFGDVKELPDDFFSCNKILDEFENIGLFTRADKEGRVYPYNLQASAVLAALESACRLLGVELITEFTLSSLKSVKSGFEAESSDSCRIFGKKCIIAAGGKASPKHSCENNCYNIAKRLGHSVAPLYPSLVQICAEDKWLKGLSGVRIKGDISLFSGSELVSKESGEVQIGNKVVSGICMMNLSAYISEYFALGTVKGKKTEDVKLILDAVPDMDEASVFVGFKKFIAEFPKAQPKDMLAGLVNSKLASELIDVLKLSRLHNVSELKEKELRVIIKSVKELVISPTGVKSWNEAQITAGGIPLTELSCRDFSSKKQPGLYFAGEILNIHGDCGGYNLSFAWLSAMRAGTAAALSCLK